MSDDFVVRVKVEPEDEDSQSTVEECRTGRLPAAPGDEEEEEEEEEDIPSDFFDDFSNQDFMEGLDIVDTWEDEVQEGGVEGQDGQSEERKEGVRRSNKQTRIAYSKERERDARLKYKNYERSPRFKDSRGRIGRLDEAKRRDPEKTRRDILRDKDRCAKDKEVRIIKERLQVVETGLVPPGMEMEVDLADIRSQQQSLTAPRVKLEPKPRLRSRSRSFERYRRPLRSRTRSRERRRMREDASPVARKRLRTRSRSPKRRTRERSRSSDLSDREKWLTRRYRRSPSPRSISPDRKRADYKKTALRRSESGVKEAKPSFLEEIHRKLNEPVPAATQIAVQRAMQLRTNYSAMQAPQQQQQQLQLPVAPALPAQLAFPSQVASVSQQQQQQYDQQFFIGSCDVPVVAPPQPVSAPALYGLPAPVPPPGAAPTLASSMPLNRALLPSTSASTAVFPAAAKTAAAKEKRNLEDTDKRALAKLLEDKKISLSDFLTITSRPSASRSLNLQDKIGVISRCQDAIKELGGDVKSSGRLFIKRYPKPETVDSRHYASPLRKIPIVRLTFTSLVKPEGDIGFSATLKKLLRSVSAAKEADARKTPQVPRTPKPRSLRKKQSKQQAAAATQSVDATTRATHLVKMCQTDPYKCEKCQVRATRKFQDQMIQCEIKTYADASTQTVAEESSPLKNKSLSHMTPAEILADAEKKKETELRVPKVEPRSDEEEEMLDAAGIMSNMERSVELDHGDKDLPDSMQQRDEKFTVWNRGRGGFPSRGRPPFRGSRGFKSFRGRKQFIKDDLDVYSPNFDDDEEYVFNRFVPPEQQFRSFDDDYYNQSGPSNQRPYFEPPDNIKKKFNRSSI